MGLASIQSWEPTGTTVTVGECLGLGGALPCGPHGLQTWFQFCPCHVLAEPLCPRL